MSLFNTKVDPKIALQRDLVVESVGQMQHPGETAENFDTGLSAIPKWPDHSVKNVRSSN